MAAKKSDKKQKESKNDETTAPKTESGRRYEIVDPKRVYAQLEAHGLPIDGTETERTDRLFSYYVHEAQKKKITLADCQPDDADDPLGCGFLSDDKLDECPFCGKGGEVVTVPKEAPKADRDIELNVKAAEKKAEDKKTGDAVAKISSKDLKKKGKGAAKEDKSVDEQAKESPKPDAIVPASPEAIDLPSENVSGTASDLDRECSEIIKDLKEHAASQAMVMWRVGQRFANIKNRKLWAAIRHENGDYAYANFGSFVAQRFADFDFTPDHAMLMIRIAGEFTQEQALALGSAKAKAILDAKNSKTAAPITEEQKTELIGLGSSLSLSELRAKIKRMQLPQLPASSSASAPASSGPSNVDRDDDDADDEDLGDEDDDDDEPESSRPATSKPAAKPAQMISVSFEKKEFSIPLAIKGSQIKPAKKIQDEPHGTLQVPGGTKIHFTVVIGEDGQLCIEGKVETPY